ncbi:uncharacterized protein LOC134693515 [Mytilus trossulus]|uniref:uncharacterized protein LOC134693515 n=1 Tax=Mytilus trossulus TaxID=6551 RepID=UPI003006D3D1
MSMEKVGVRISARIHQHKQPTDTTIKVKPYVMGPEKAMNKKEDSCDRNMVTFAMKSNNNFRAELSTAAYEILKVQLFDKLDTMSCSDFPSLGFSVQNNVDQVNTIVFQTIKVTLTKGSSNSTNKQLKFTVNLYNSTSSIVANGNGVRYFVDNFFTPILEYLHQHSDNIDIINNSVKGMIVNSKIETISENHLNKSSERQTLAITDSLSTNTSASVNMAHIDTTSRCPICSDVANDDTINCDTCLEWFHYSCVQLNKSKVDKIPSIAPFTCPLCCNDLLHTNTTSTIETLCIPTDEPIPSIPSSANINLPSSGVISNISTSSSSSVLKSSISVANSVPYVIPTTTSSNFSTACLTSTLHQIQSTSSCNTTNTTSVSSGAISSIISPIKSKKKAPNKLMLENDNLRSFIIELEQKINDQERTINLLKSAKPSNEYTSTQTFTNNQNNMNGLPNSGYKENMDNIEKKLATLMDYQHMLAFSNLNSRIDNLQNTMMKNPHTPFSTVQNPYAPSFPIQTHFQHNVHPHSYFHHGNSFTAPFRQVPNMHIPVNPIYQHEINLAHPGHNSFTPSHPFHNAHVSSNITQSAQSINQVHTDSSQSLHQRNSHHLTKPPTGHYSNRNLSNAQANSNTRRGPSHTKRTHPPSYGESVSRIYSQNKRDDSPSSSSKLIQANNKPNINNHSEVNNTLLQSSETKVIENIVVPSNETKFIDSQCSDPFLDKGMTEPDIREM